MKMRQVNLAFPEKGLVLVQGINTASGGALLSVGSGKSSIGEAISRTLLGVPGRFTHLKSFSTGKAGDLYVKLEAELLGKPLVVESGFKCAELGGPGEALRYSYDGTTVERAKIDQTRAELNKLLGVSALLASWTAFIDGDCIKFNKLGQTDAVDLVMSSLRQPPWSSYHDASKKTLGEFRRSMTATETEHRLKAETVAVAIQSLKSANAALESARDAYAEACKQNSVRIGKLGAYIDTKHALILTAEAEVKKCRLAIQALEKAKAEKNHALEIKMHDIEDQLTAAQEARKPFSDARNTAATAATEARVAHSNYSGAARDCPTCKRPMGTLDAARLQQLADAHADAKKALTEAEDRLADAQKKVDDLNGAYVKASREQRELSAMSVVESHSDRIGELTDSISATKDGIRAAENEIAELERGTPDTAVRSAEDRVADREDALQLAQDSLAKAAVTLATDQATLKVLEYWNMAFSPYGIPNMVLRDAIAPLNKEARRVSSEMTGGTIEVRFSTVREMASGLEKAQLNIEVDNKLGDKELGGSSKGEGGLTNFILSETLSEVGQVSRRVGYRFYDEIVPHQDPKVCGSIYAYMKETAERLGILVFLVDHNPVAANYADHFLIVEKKGEGDKVQSTLRWR